MQTTPVTAAGPMQVTVWTWLIKIRDVNYPADELTVDMFVTFTYDLRFKDKINPMKHFEIVEAKSVTVATGGRVSTGAGRILPILPVHSRHWAPLGHPLVPLRPPQDPLASRIPRTKSERWSMSQTRQRPRGDPD